MGRKAGRRNGPLDRVALEFPEFLAHLVSYCNGRLEPSLAFFAENLRRHLGIADATSRAHPARG